MDQNVAHGRTEAKIGKGESISHDCTEEVARWTDTGNPAAAGATPISHHHTTLDIVQMGMEIEVRPLQVGKMATHTHIASDEDADLTCGTNGYSGHCHSLESHHNTQTPSSGEVNRPVRPGSLRTGTDGNDGRGRTEMTAEDATPGTLHAGDATCRERHMPSSAVLGRTRQISVTMIFASKTSSIIQNLKSIQLYTVNSTLVHSHQAM
jgi:hypothetical protein